jgi:hypothetical protein
MKQTLRKPTELDTVCDIRTSQYTTLYDTKVTKTGNYYRVARYSQQQSKRWIQKSRPRGESKAHLPESATPPTPELTPEQRLQKNRNRAITNLIDLTRTNFHESKSYKQDFATRVIRISFKDLPKDRKQMYRWLQYSAKLFHKRFGFKMDYTIVDEEGSQTQRLHQHIVIFKAPYLSNEEWNQTIFKRGFVKAQTCYSTNIAHYQAKYFSKDIAKKEQAVRAYSCSKGLQKPKVIIDGAQVELTWLLHSNYAIQESEWIKNPYTGQFVKYQIWIPPA